MTKKGIVLSVILIMLLAAIAFIVYKQNFELNSIIKTKEEKKKNNIDFDFIITSDVGFDINRLKSYKLPIIIQLRIKQ